MSSWAPARDPAPSSPLVIVRIRNSCTRPPSSQAGTGRALSGRRRIPKRPTRRSEGLPRRHIAASSTAQASLFQMPEEKIRLGGMALANGVLVHGPTAWACAIRSPGGELKVESAYKRVRAAEVGQPLLRGPARLAEGMVLLPPVRRALPHAPLPFERP